MFNFSFPRWSGPFVGAAVVGLVTLAISIRQDDGISWHWKVLGGAAFGGGIGLIMMILDVKPRKPMEMDEQSSRSNSPPDEPDVRIKGENTRIQTPKLKHAPAALGSWNEMFQVQRRYKVRPNPMQRSEAGYWR